MVAQGACSLQAAESEPIAPADTADAVAAAFAPAESVLFTAHRDRRVRSWSVTEAGGAAVLHEIWATDFCQEDKTLAVSPDGSLVAAACEADGRVRLWSAASGVTVTDLRYPGQVKTVAFSRDAHMLIAGGEKQLRSFVVSGSAVVDEACSRLTRNMSLAEWQRHIGGRCELVCPRLPGCQ